MNCLSDNNASLLTQMLSLSTLSGYRSFWYLWSNSESSFAQVEDVPNYIEDVSTTQLYLKMFLKLRRMDMHVANKYARFAAFH